jgi:predicted ATPase
MRIKKIHIQNYKSLVDFELDSPPPFCAFVGPNASGKSNIFEALEFMNYVARFGFEAPSFFGGGKNIFSFQKIKPMAEAWELAHTIEFALSFNDNINIGASTYFNDSLDTYGLSVDSPTEGDFITDFSHIQNTIKRERYKNDWKKAGNKYDNDYEIFVDNFSHVFIGNPKLIRINQPSSKLLSDASNLSQIIGRIFQDERKREDFIEWVQILIPEFQNIEVKKSNIDGSFEFFVYEKSSDKPFPKHLISDGTYNILALMAAVYQSSEPQFLCIEEPENGLHPHAIQFLMDFFREKCEDEGHHIWLNSQSPTLVRCLEIEEVILVNKIDGQTRAKRVTNMGDIDINTDEAWLTNALGGGTLWSK